MAQFYSISSKIELPRDVRNSKGRRHDKFRKDWSQHKNKCKSQMGQGQGSGGVSIFCWLATHVAMFYGNLLNLVIRSKSIIRSSLVISSQIGVMSDQLRVSLYMVMSQNVMKHLGEGDFIMFDEIPISTIKLPSNKSIVAQSFRENLVEMRCNGNEDNGVYILQI